MKYFILALSVLVIFSCKKKKDTPDTPDTTINQNDQDYAKANGIKGGMLYNTFWDPLTGHDLKDTVKLKTYKAKPDFFKCKQCHAWDQQGNLASYIGRAPNANRPRVAISLLPAISNYTPISLFNAIKTGNAQRRSINYDLTTYNPITNFVEGDKMPNYSEILTDKEIWDIVKFLKTERVDLTQLYDYATTGAYPSGTIAYSNIGKDGNSNNGLLIYQNKGCGTNACHGTDGKAILVDNSTYTLGGFIKAKPNEAQHKIKFGQMENSGMPAHNLTVQELKHVYKVLSDTTLFPLQ